MSVRSSNDQAKLARQHRSYFTMWLIRKFDERAMQLYSDGEIKGSVHPSIGQEAVAVGICDALNDDDYLASTHRGHGHAIAKGADVQALMAELLARETGACRGKGGSMHVTDLGKGLLGANGIVGANIHLATGAALASQVRKSGQVAVAVFGDGAVSSGAFHEALNLSSLWRLPVVYVCENNQYSVTLRTEDGVAAESIADFAGPYRIPGQTVDGMSLEAVQEATADAVERARDNRGPSLIETLTYRYLGHSRGDPPYGTYRQKEEVETWRKRDPIERFEASSGMERERASELESMAADLIESAIEAARGAPQPGSEALFQHVYSDREVVS